MNDTDTGSLSNREVLIGLALTSPLLLILVLIVDLIAG
jgi:hypothetical protein